MIENRDAAVAWWQELQPDPAAGRGGDRATLARLRRCPTIAELMLEPATIALFRRCEADDTRDLPTIALAAGVLAFVRADDPAQKVARQVGPETPDAPETALLKPLRFHRLMEAGSDDDRLLAFRRLVALADRRLNVRDLAAALLRWDEDCRRRWVFAYWNADPVRPAAPAKESAA